MPTAYRYAALYDSDTVWNLVDNEFVDAGDSTRWIMKCDCRASSLLQHILINVFRRSLTKQSMLMMTNFKALAEETLQ